MIRPIYHQLEPQIEAYIFVAFLVYCLHVTLARQIHRHAPELTPPKITAAWALDATPVSV